MLVHLVAFRQSIGTSTGICVIFSTLGHKKGDTYLKRNFRYIFGVVHPASIRDKVQGDYLT